MSIDWWLFWAVVFGGVWALIGVANVGLKLYVRYQERRISRAWGQRPIQDLPSVNVTGMRFQCPDCGTPIDVVRTRNPREPLVLVEPCAHIVDVGAIF